MSETTTGDPINQVQWRPADALHANSWNPNVVFTPELKLLERSILKCGWIQPIIVNPDGLVIDGFTMGACLHKGGFATIWEVTHPDHAGKLAMKVPTILDGFDAPTIVGFEVEQMIVPRLTGPHVPKVVALGDFSSMPYIVTEWIGGGSLLEVFRDAPLAFLDMIAVHELAHLREREHDKAFYRLCQHMLPEYHQLELELRLYLTHLEAGGERLWAVSDLPA